MISLFPFQVDASTTIATRYRNFITDPERPRQKGYGPLPFYQSLHALTGSGKTPILADAVAQMRTTHPVEPIVLWISKARVVVEQTLANFSDGGKYREFVGPFQAMALRDCTPRDIEDGGSGLLLLGTVATFNSKERGDRLIFDVRTDKGGLSLWDALIERKMVGGVKRPMVIVYDEGHNLSDQQADLLLELRPEAIIVASATPRLPRNLVSIIEMLKHNGYTDDDLKTAIRSTAVVEAELVKREIDLGGYVTAEEDAISAMLADYRALAGLPPRYGATFTPKCIYVCKTNVPGDELRPFTAREAPPIRIWRYLVEGCGVDPAQIAVYCDLKISAAQPLPPEFILFGGGENDYAAFTTGGYRHIIFNLSLQEGWDDPECYLAYIDKSMGSAIQIEQIVGRVLRQPGARYYPDAKLNTCGFYIHVDEAGVFMDILKTVQHRLAQDVPAVEVVSTGGTARIKRFQPPRVGVELPAITVQMAAAVEPVQEVLDAIGDYKDSPDALATGRVAQVAQEIGQAGATTVEWVEKGQGLPVTVQWLLGRQIDRQYRAARAVCDLNDPRFTRLIQLGSRAAKQVENQANALVATFLQHVSLGVFPDDPVQVGEVAYDVDKHDVFKNSVHPAYSGLNEDERECAMAIDELSWTWCRNPSNGGYALPLFEPGMNRSFYPDFIVWTKTAIWLIDPKGDHLIRSDAGKKLIAVDTVPGQVPVKVCLITRGTWDRTYNKLNDDGATAWRLRSGLVNNPEHYADIGRLLRKIVGVKS